MSSFTSHNMRIECIDLGLMPYKEAWDMQNALRERRMRGNVADTILLVEHHPVFTMGRRDCSEDFFSTQEIIASDGIEVIKTNRGGRVTYHGPGQLVVYFIFDLAALGIGIKEFVFAVEDACIQMLDHYGIEAGRDLKHPGVWVGRNKLVAIGMHVAHGITQHGLAVNVNCDLSPYRHIVACGIRDRGVTSMAKLIECCPVIDEVKKGLVGCLQEIFAKSAVLKR